MEVVLATHSSLADNLNMFYCLFIFLSADNPILTTCAMALSGFTEEKNALWRKTCGALRQNLRNPYLRAMFAFLSAEKDSFDEVLVGEIFLYLKATLIHVHVIGIQAYFVTKLDYFCVF